MTVSRLLISSLGAMLTVTTGARAEPPKAAVFDFQLANLGIQGPTDADKARLKPLSDQLRSLLKESARYEIVLTDPVKEDVATKRVRQCTWRASELAYRKDT